jgi:hypothetical protein
MQLIMGLEFIMNIPSRIIFIIDAINHSVFFILHVTTLILSYYTLPLLLGSYGFLDQHHSIAKCNERVTVVDMRAFCFEIFIIRVTQCKYTAVGRTRVFSEDMANKSNFLSSA